MEDKIVIYSKQSGEPRVPLTVRIDWLSNGTIKPQMYWTPDGTCYKVIFHYESVLLAFLKDGGEGLRFKLRSEIIETPESYSELLHTQHETYLYLANKRFVRKTSLTNDMGTQGKNISPSHWAFSQIAITNLFTFGIMERCIWLKRPLP